MVQPVLRHARFGVTSLLVLSIAMAGCTRGGSSTNGANAPEVSSSEGGNALTAEEVSQLSQGSQPIFMAISNELGQKIVGLDVFRKGEDGLYETSSAAQYLVVYLADASSDVGQGVSPLRASVEALFNQSTDGVKQDMIEIGEIRNALEISGITKDHPEVRERMNTFAAAIESKVADASQEFQDNAITTSFVVAAGVGAVTFMIPTSKAPAVKQKIQEAVVSHAQIQRQRRAVVNGPIALEGPSSQVGNYMSRLSPSSITTAQEVLKAARVQTVSLNGLRKTIERASHGNNAPAVEARNQLFRLLEVAGAKSTLLGRVGDTSVHGIRGVEMAALGNGAGKKGTLTMRWRGDTRVVKPKDAKYSPTAHPQIDAAHVVRGEDGGAVILKIKSDGGEEYIAFYTTEAADKSAQRLGMVVANGEAAKNFAALVSSIKVSKSLSSVAVVVDTVTGKTASMLTRVRKQVSGLGALVGPKPGPVSVPLLTSSGSSTVAAEAAEAVTRSGLRQRLTNAGGGFVLGFTGTTAYFYGLDREELDMISAEDIQNLIIDEDSFEMVEAVEAN